MKLPFSVLTKFHQTVQITSELRAAVTPHALAPRSENTLVDMQKPIEKFLEPLKVVWLTWKTLRFDLNFVF